MRVLLLHGDENSGGGMGVIANLADVVKALKGRCRRIKGCELVVMAESSFTNFCQQVRPHPNPPHSRPPGGIILCSAGVSFIETSAFEDANMCFRA